MNNTTTLNTFNSLHCANRLKAVDVPAKQAEEFAEILSETIDNNLATKTDIKFLELKIEQVKRETRIFGSIILAGIMILGLLIQTHH